MKTLISITLVLLNVITTNIDLKNYNLFYDCSYKLLDVIDGDTILVEKCIQQNKCNKYNVRYLGIDTPELHKSKYDAQFFANEAKNFNKSLLNQNLCLEFELYNRYDIYKRLLAYVYNSSGYLINEILVENGYAKYYDYDQNLKYKNKLLLAQNKAISNKKGIWDKNKLKNHFINKTKINEKDFINYKNKYISTIFNFKSFNVSNNNIKFYTDYKNQGNYVILSIKTWELYFKPFYKKYENLLNKNVYVEGLLRYIPKKNTYYIQINSPWELYL